MVDWRASPSMPSGAENETGSDILPISICAVPLRLSAKVWWAIDMLSYSNRAPNEAERCDPKMRRASICPNRANE